jgi:hypothetical protein
MTKDQVLASLPSLSHDDLKAIRAVIGGLLGEKASGGLSVASDHPYEWLTAAIGAAIGHKGPMNGYTVREFKKRAPVAMTFINENFADAMKNKTSALAMMRYLIILLIDDMKIKRMPVTLVTVTQNLHRLQEVFNNAFPGYGTEQAAYIIARLAVFHDARS